MGKRGKRDLDYIIKGSEAYRNIIRDNERYDYIE